MIPKTIISSLLFVLPGALAASVHDTDCYASLSGDTLKIGNSAIERVYLWNNGQVKTCRIIDKKSGKVFESVKPQPDFVVNHATPSEGKLSTHLIPSDEIRPRRLVATVSYKLGNLDVERDYRLYDSIAAIAVDTRLRGRLDGKVENDLSEGDRGNIEHQADMKVKPVTALLDRVSLPGRHWHGTAIEFRDITDWNNNLVDSRDFISYHKTNHRGNILIINNGADTEGGLVFLKEAPTSGVQLAYNKADFISDAGNFMVTGLGVDKNDVAPGKWTTTYSTVLCTYGGSELSALKSLRDYQKQCRIHNPHRDEMVMMNTWGDRSQDSKVNESFCLNELENAARLGITLFQIDDGWQYGKSPNSATAGGSFNDIYSREGYWTPNPEKYPRGLRPVVDRGRELGIEVGLWFNPSVQNDFADWEKDAATIVRLWKEYGIKVFKIDGLNVVSKRGEESLRKLFDRVLDETGNEVMFNLDVTAGRRMGYHFFNEYGNIFLENRYTDWGNYYPYWTLRNLWMLSRYVPAEKLQIEFLNKWRNESKYIDDPFAPANYDFGYLFAIAMAGQPLAWMESANLPEEAYAIKPLVEAYKGVAHDFHNGTILPVGCEPSGRSWTGFQSVGDDCSGYLLIFRELTDSDRTKVPTWLPAGSKVELRPVLGNGKGYTAKVDETGRIDVRIDRPNDFVMYKYTIK